MLLCRPSLHTEIRLSSWGPVRSECAAPASLSAAQLRHTYTTGIRRNDHCIFHYGFIQESDTPALVEQDLPAGNLYDVSPYSETDYGELRAHREATYACRQLVLRHVTDTKDSIRVSCSCLS